jgi:predicted transcriptional regulator
MTRQTRTEPTYSPVTIALPEQTMQRLTKAALRAQVSKNLLVVNALEYFLHQLEKEQARL